MAEEGWTDDPGVPAEDRFEVAFPPAPALRPTPAPPPATLVPLPLSVRVADRLHAIPWWVRFVVPAVAAFALVAGIGDLTKGTHDQRTETAGAVATSTTDAPTTTATSTPTTTAATAPAGSSTTGASTTTSGNRRSGTTTTTSAARTQPLVTVPTSPTVPVPITSPTVPDPGPTDGGDSAAAYYASCAEAKSAGAAPLLRGLPGYRAGLDPDGDGLACED